MNSFMNDPEFLTRTSRINNCKSTLEIVRKANAYASDLLLGKPSSENICSLKKDAHLDATLKNDSSFLSSLDTLEKYTNCKETIENVSIAFMSITKALTKYGTILSNI